MMKKFVFILILLAATTIAQAKFEIQTSTGYTSNTDGETQNAFSDMTNHLFIGASFDSKEKIVIGQNVSMVSNQYKTSGATDKLSTMELGPRLNYYINNDKTFFAAITWNPYARGTRTVSGTAEKISGWSYLAALGATAKMGSNFYLGASLNYHALMISETVVGTTSSTVSNSYTSLMPMLNITFRFR